MEQLADMIAVIPDFEDPADQVSDAAGRPGVVIMSMLQWTLLQEGPKLSVLIWGQSRGWAGGNRRLQRAVAFQTGLPTIDGVDGDTEVLRNLGVGMRTLLKPGEGREPTFFELRASEVSREPAGHQLRISVHSYTEINKMIEAVLDNVLPL